MAPIWTSIWRHPQIEFNGGRTGVPGMKPKKLTVIDAQSRTYRYARTSAASNTWTTFCAAIQTRIPLKAKSNAHARSAGLMYCAILILVTV